MVGNSCWVGLTFAQKKKFAFRLLLLFSVIGLFSGVSSAAVYYTANFSLVNGFNSTLTNYVAQVEGDTSNATVFNASCSNVYFSVDNCSTAIASEIDSGCGTNSTLWWVGLASAENATTLYACMNALADDGNASSVAEINTMWRNANYVGVWHLNNTGTQVDSVGYTNLIQTSGCTLNATTSLGNGITFDGANCAYYQYDPVELPAEAGASTESYWINPNTNVGVLAIGMYGMDDVLATRGIVSCDADGCGFSATDYDFNSAALLGTGQPPADGWTIVTGKFDGTNRYVYLNASEIGSDIPTTPFTILTDISIGRHLAGVYYFNGTMTEVRIRNESSSADWLAAENSTKFVLDTITKSPEMNVSILSPSNNYTLPLGSTNLTVNFMANSNSANDSIVCGLYINGTINVSDANVSNATLTQLNATGLILNENYSMYVSCNDSILIANSSSQLFSTFGANFIIQAAACPTNYVRIVRYDFLDEITNESVLANATITIATDIYGSAVGAVSSTNVSRVCKDSSLGAFDGAITVIYSNASSSTRWNTKAVDETTNVVQNLYLLALSSGTNYSFHVINNYGQSITNAQLTFYRLNVGGYVQVDSQATDFTGTVVELLQPSIYYNLYVTAPGYTSINQSFLPLSNTNWTVQLTGFGGTVNSSTIGYTQLLNDTAYYLVPTGYYYNSSQNVTFTVIANGSVIEYYGMNITLIANGTSYPMFADNITGLSAGGTINYTATLQGTYIVEYWLKRVNYTVFHPFAKTFQISNQTGLPNLVGVTSDFGWVFISLVIAMIVGGYVSQYNFNGGAIAAVLAFWFMTMLNWNAFIIVGSFHITMYSLAALMTLMVGIVTYLGWGN